MHPVLESIYLLGLVPVVKIDQVEQAVPLAKALCEGGLPCAEITFRTAQAEEAIRRIHQEVPQMLLGAGTVISIAQVDAAVAAGAQFIVSPGFNRKVVDHCRNIGVPITPGCSGPSDIERAIESGLEIVKFFPAEAMGGLKTIQAICAPYPQMRFIPTGGVDQKNLLSYLNHPKILACGGSFMVKSEWLDAGDYESIKNAAREAVELVLGFRLAHIGINSENAQQGGATADTLFDAFGFPTRVTSKSTFVGKPFEVMHEKGPGEHGHIALGTHNVDRAVAYLKRRGVSFREDTARRNEKGQLSFIYLEPSFGGFDIHLTL